MDLTVTPQLIKALRRHYQDKGFTVVDPSLGSPESFLSPLSQIAADFGLEHSGRVSGGTAEEGADGKITNLSMYATKASGKTKPSQLIAGERTSIDQDAFNLYLEMIHDPRGLYQGATDHVGNKARLKRVFGNLTDAETHNILDRLYQHGLYDLLKHSLTDPEEQKVNELPRTLLKKANQWEKLPENISKFDGSQQSPSAFIDEIPDAVSFVDRAVGSAKDLVGAFRNTMGGSDDVGPKEAGEEETLNPALISMLYDFNDDLAFGAGIDNDLGLQLRDIADQFGLEQPNFIRPASDGKKDHKGREQVIAEGLSRVLRTNKNVNQDAYDLFAYLIFSHRSDMIGGAIKELEASGPDSKVQEFINSEKAMRRKPLARRTPLIIHAMLDRLREYGLLDMLKDQYQVVDGQVQTLLPKELKDHIGTWERLKNMQAGRASGTSSEPVAVADEPAFASEMEGSVNPDLIQRLRDHDNAMTLSVRSNNTFAQIAEEFGLIDKSPSFKENRVTGVFEMRVEGGDTSLQANIAHGRSRIYGRKSSLEQDALDLYAEIISDSRSEIVEALASRGDNKKRTISFMTQKYDRMFKAADRERIFDVLDRLERYGFLDLLERNLARIPAKPGSTQKKAASHLPKRLNTMLATWDAAKPIETKIELLSLQIKASTARLMQSRLAKLADDTRDLNAAFVANEPYPFTFQELYQTMQTAGFYLDEILKVDEIAGYYAQIPDGAKNDELRQRLLVSAREGMKPDSDALQKIQFHMFESARALGQLEELDALLDSPDCLFPPEETKALYLAWQTGEMPKEISDFREVLQKVFPEESEEFRDPVIQRKQAFFDKNDPPEILGSMVLNGGASIPEFTEADNRASSLIIDDKGFVPTVPYLQAADSSDVSFNLRKAMVFSILIANSTEASVDLRRNLSDEYSALNREDQMLAARALIQEGVETPELRDAAYKVVDKYKLWPELYLTSRRSDSFFVPEMAEDIIRYCQLNDIDLHGQLMAYPLPDILYVSNITPHHEPSMADDFYVEFRKRAIEKRDAEDAKIYTLEDYDVPAQVDKADKKIDLEDAFKDKLVDIARASHTQSYVGKPLMRRMLDLIKATKVDDITGISDPKKALRGSNDPYRDAVLLTKVIFADNTKSVILEADRVSGTVSLQKAKRRSKQFFNGLEKSQLDRLLTRIEQYGLLDELKAAALSDSNTLPQSLAGKITKWRERHARSDVGADQQPITPLTPDPTVDFKKDLSTQFDVGGSGEDALYDDTKRKLIDSRKRYYDQLSDINMHEPYDAVDNSIRDIPRIVVPGLLPDGVAADLEPGELSGEFDGMVQISRRGTRNVVIQREKRDLAIEALKNNPEIDNDTLKEFTHPDFDTEEGRYFTVIHAETYPNDAGKRNWTQLAVSVAEGDPTFVVKDGPICDPQTGKSAVGIRELRDRLLTQAIRYHADNPEGYQSNIDRVFTMRKEDVKENTKTSIQWQKLSKHGDMVANQVFSSYADHIRTHGSLVRTEGKEPYELIIKTGEERESPEDPHISLLYRTRWDRVMWALTTDGGKITGMSEVKTDKALALWAVNKDPDLMGYLEEADVEWMTSPDDDAHDAALVVSAEDVSSAGTLVSEAADALAGREAANDDTVEIDGKFYPRAFILGKLGL